VAQAWAVVTIDAHGRSLHEEIFAKSQAAIKQAKFDEMYKTGKFEMDYVVKRHQNQVHVLNAVSPGWTSSIPFARWIVSEFLCN
jgi:hypothetical protein